MLQVVLCAQHTPFDGILSYQNSGGEEQYLTCQCLSVSILRKAEQSLSLSLSLSPLTAPIGVAREELSTQLFGKGFTLESHPDATRAGKG